VSRRPQSAFYDELFSDGFPQIYSAVEFKAIVRLPREVFFYVAEKIANDPAFAVPPNVGPRAISVQQQLLCFLLRVGGNKPSSEAARCSRISPSSVPSCLRRVAKAIVRTLGPLHLVMPRNGSVEKARVRAMFKRKHNMFSGACGILDCTAWSVVVPTGYSRAGLAAAFLNRKHKKTLTFQALTTPEASPRFLDMDGGLPGSAYDTRVLEGSDIYKDIDKFLEGEEYWMGDLGYATREWLQTGFRK
jgi:hypothetical protein